jgi:hypothetical protein
LEFVAPVLDRTPHIVRIVPSIYQHSSISVVCMCVLVLWIYVYTILYCIISAREDQRLSLG